MSITISKVKNGYQGYAYYYDENNKRHKKSAGRHKLRRQAKEAALELEAKLKENNSASKDISFYDYYNRWFDLYKKNKAQSHSASYQYELFGKLIKKYFKKTKLKDIVRSDYQAFINWYGKHHAYESVRKLKGACDTCISYAIDDGIINRNFTRNVEIAYNKDNSRKTEYLSNEELHRLKEFIVSKLERYNTSRYMILTAIYTGMRKAEIQALTWNDIDFLHSTISISKSWDEREKAFKPTKTKSSNRVIRVNRKLLKYLEDLKANGSTMVFKNVFGTIPTSNALNSCLHSIMKEAKLNKKDFTFHSLRHVHVAYLIGQGVDINAISKRLGHSNINITLGVYSYLIEEYKNKNDDLIVKKLESI